MNRAMERFADGSELRSWRCSAHRWGSLGGNFGEGHLSRTRSMGNRRGQRRCPLWWVPQRWEKRRVSRGTALDDMRACRRNP